MFQAAMYLRLSKEDREAGQSNSIQSQRSLIQAYVRDKKDIQIVAEEIDDGYSGLSFQRPGFLSLLEKVQKGKINCIIVKDLSRFSRNYIEAGRYLDSIFPRLGVRFLSVLEEYDSFIHGSYTQSLLIPFRNLMNDFYSGDISRKTKSSLESRRKQGALLSSFAPYGYKKKENNKNQLTLDPISACVVRRIFREKLNGKSNRSIAEGLNRDHISSPYEYKITRGLSYYSALKGHQEAMWHEKTVYRILKDTVYIGQLSQGKTTALHYKMKERVKIPSQQWIQVKHTHAPIIPETIFSMVNKELLSDTRQPPGKKWLLPFSGLLFCGDCGRNLIHDTITSKQGKKYRYYVCSGYRKEKDCTPHRMQTEMLTAFFLEIRDVYFLYHKRLPLYQEFFKQENTPSNRKYMPLRAFLLAILKCGFVYEKNRMEFCLDIPDFIVTGLFSGGEKNE